MNNVPQIKIGLVTVSRDCFPASLSESRRDALAKAYAAKYDASELYVCPTIIESETDMMKALEDVKAAGCDALCVFLGNFGPEIPETMIAKQFSGPSMFVAAAEESQQDLLDGRGDALCGLLSASYNLNMRGVKAYIPERPVGTAEELADRISEFVPIARTLVALKDLKLISFGPRPYDFLTCNAPIKQIFDLGVEVEENSEMDLYDSYLKHADDPRIADVVADMAAELGAGNLLPDILPKLAQYELTLRDWAEQHKGARKYVVLTTKCWPAFQSEFGFVPCYVNSRIAGSGIPVGCEVDIYGALSEYIGQVISGDAVTILDINNSIPQDMYEESIKGKYDYKQSDTVMCFHCGNTCSSRLQTRTMCNQRIMSRNLPLTVTKGTMEGDLVPGDVTLYRLQGTAEGGISAYIAEGEVLPVATRSYGGTGVFAFPEMGRFYRHVLLEKHFPHHGAVAFGHYGKALYEVFKLLGVPVSEIGFNQPAGMRYPEENPF